MGKNLLITGATGFLGSYLAAELLRRGHTVYALSRPKGQEGHDERLRRVLGAWRRGPSDDLPPGRLEVLLGDVASPDFGLSGEVLRHLASVDVELLHCAACTSFSAVSSDPAGHTNVVGAENLLALSRKIGARALHFVSTAYVAGDFRGRFGEDDLIVGQGFHNDYEQTKYLAELLVRGSGLGAAIPVNIFRPAIIMGESRAGKTTNFNTFYPYFRILASVKRKFQERLSKNQRALRRIGVTQEGGTLVLPLRISADPRTVKNIVPVDFVGEGIAAVVEAPGAGVRTFHLTNPDPPALSWLNDEFNAALGVRGIRLVEDSAFDAEGPNSLENLVSNATKVYRPYLRRDPAFDSAATHAALRLLGVHFPDLRTDYFRKLVRYALAVDAETERGEPAEQTTTGLFFQRLEGRVGQRLIPNLRSLDTRFSIHLSDLDACFSLSIERGVLKELADREVAGGYFSFTLASDTLGELIEKKLKPQEAFFASRVEIEGDMVKALALAPIFDEFFSILEPQ